METSWVSDPSSVQSGGSDRNIAGRTLFLGPFVFGRFKYVDEVGGGFWFVTVRGTKLCIHGDW